LQLEEKPAPKDAKGEPFQYQPTAPVPLYGRNTPSLEKIFFAVPREKRQHDDAGQSSAKKLRVTKILGRKKRAPIIPVPDSDDSPVCFAPNMLWPEIPIL
jgi:hypothetical protein